MKKLSQVKQKIWKALQARGFTANHHELMLFFYRNDGWYLHCDQCEHSWIGSTSNAVISLINDGSHDHHIKAYNANPDAYKESDNPIDKTKTTFIYKDVDAIIDEDLKNMRNQCH